VDVHALTSSGRSRIIRSPLEVATVIIAFAVVGAFDWFAYPDGTLVMLGREAMREL
jgi:hypothetical protein